MSCVLCKQNESIIYDHENGYEYRQCTACRCIYLWPRPAETQRQNAINLGIHQGAKPLKTVGTINLNKQLLYKKMLSKLGMDKRLLVAENTLDIGAGHGEWALLMRDMYSATSHAVEPQLDKRNWLNKEQIKCYENLDEVIGSFDIISLLNVFSHLPNPTFTFKKIYKLLKTKGYFIMQTGNSAHLQANKHPKPYLAPDHLQFTDLETLQKLLKQYEFKIITHTQNPIQYSYKHPEFFKAIAKVFLGKLPLKSIINGNLSTDLWIVCQKI